MMNNYSKEETIFRRRLLDLANMAERRGISTYTDFLNLHEQNIVVQMTSELPSVQVQSYGGYVDAERKMICFNGTFSSMDDNENSFPIACIQIQPVNQKFSNQLTHRDFLGAILNLGIERSKIGDIITQENMGYVFCNRAVRDFILDELMKVKHTTIKTSPMEQQEFSYKPALKEMSGTISSNRLDSIISVAFKSSRSSLSEVIRGGKVFVNSKLVETNSYVLKENDVVSVRGYGKFIFKGMNHMTKKGRYSVTLLLYVG